VIEAVGLVQFRGDDVVEICPGDGHTTADGQEHWGGAAPDEFTSHISIMEGPATWGDQVTDGGYGTRA
jgi:hypothetical protein